MAVGAQKHVRRAPSVGWPPWLFEALSFDEDRLLFFAKEVQYAIPIDGMCGGRRSGVAYRSQRCWGVSRAALAQVGLVGMQPMTDIEGVSVRGNGFALVSGSSFAFSVTGKPYAKFQTSAAPIGGKTVAIGYAGGLFSIANGGAVAYAK